MVSIMEDSVMPRSRALVRTANNGFGPLILASLLLCLALAHMWTDAPMMARAIGPTTAYGLASIMTSLAAAVAGLLFVD